MARTKQMILCDTNILIEFYKNKPNIIGELRNIGQRNLAISAITQAELYFGAINKKELQKIRQHLSLLNLIPLNNEASKEFITLMEKYSLSHKLSIPDALIASTAIVHQKELYTLNIRDFCFISELRLYHTEGKGVRSRKEAFFTVKAITQKGRGSQNLLLPSIAASVVYTRMQAMSAFVEEVNDDSLTRRGDHRERLRVVGEIAPRVWAGGDPGG